MPRFYVFWEDDYYEEGGVGFEGFDTVEEALEFIQERIKKSDNIKIDLNRYKLICGKQLLLAVKEIASKIECLGS